MANDEPDELHCNLTLEIARYGGLNSSYGVELGLDRRTQVILTVTLSKEEGELLATTKELMGNVRHYRFHVYRDLITDE